MFHWRNKIERVQEALQHSDKQKRRQIILTAEELAHQLDEKARRPSIVASIKEELVWVIDRIEMFRVGHWSAGIGIFVLRIIQTSVLVLIPRQNLQVEPPH